MTFGHEDCDACCNTIYVESEVIHLCRDHYNKLKKHEPVPVVVSVVSVCGCPLFGDTGMVDHIVNCPHKVTP